MSDPDELDRSRNIADELQVARAWLLQLAREVQAPRTCNETARVFLGPAAATKRASASGALISAVRDD